MITNQQKLNLKRQELGAEQNPEKKQRLQKNVELLQLKVDIDKLKERIRALMSGGAG